MRKLAFLVASLPLLSGCEDAPPTALAPSSGDNPSFTFVNNPDNGNPHIMWFEEGSGFLIVGSTTDLFPLQEAKDLWCGCNTFPTLFTWLDVQHVHQDPLAGQINEALLGRRGVCIAVFENYAGGRHRGGLAPRSPLGCLRKVPATSGSRTTTCTPSCA